MRSGSAGFTLLELMLVIGILAVMASLAIPGFGYLSANTKVKSASTELYLAMIRARSEAVKRNRSVAVITDAAGWQAGWRVTVDANNDDDFVDAEDTVVYQQGALKGVSINLDCDGDPDEVLLAAAEDNTRVKYRPSGRVMPEAAADLCDGPPSFEVTSVDRDRQAALMRCVRVDLTGRPYVTTDGVTADNC